MSIIRRKGNKAQSSPKYNRVTSSPWLLPSSRHANSLFCAICVDKFHTKSTASNVSVDRVPVCPHDPEKKKTGVTEGEKWKKCLFYLCFCTSRWLHFSIYLTAVVFTNSHKQKWEELVPGRNASPKMFQAPVAQRKSTWWFHWSPSLKAEGVKNRNKEKCVLFSSSRRSSGGRSVSCSLSSGPWRCYALMRVIHPFTMWKWSGWTLVSAWIYGSFKMLYSLCWSSRSLGFGCVKQLFLIK